MKKDTKNLEGGIYDFVKRVGQKLFETNVDNPNKVNNYQPINLPPKSVLYDMVKNTYNRNSKRPIPNWNLIKETPTLLFYLKDKTIVVAVRGSIDFVDLGADTGIAIASLLKSTRYTTDLNTLYSVQQNYPPSEYTYYGVAHSLGGAILQKWIRNGLIKEGISYNPALEKVDINDTTSKHLKIYNEDDPLYMLMGKNASNVEVRPNKKSGLANVAKEQLSQFSLGRAINSVQAHLLGNFEGGQINKHFPLDYGVGSGNDEYLEKARELARKNGYPDYASVNYAKDGKHKLILRGVKFGNTNYDDFISYKLKEGKEVADKHRKAYLARATKIKGNWKDDPYSPNNLAIRILWGGGRKKKVSTVSKKAGDWEDIKWGSFSNQFKVWKLRHPEYTHINTLDDFATMILQAPQAFKPITIKRARFYQNVLKPQDRPEDLEGGIAPMVAAEIAYEGAKLVYEFLPDDAKKWVDTQIDSVKEYAMNVLNEIFNPEEVAEARKKANAEAFAKEQYEKGWRYDDEGNVIQFPRAPNGDLWVKLPNPSAPEKFVWIKRTSAKAIYEQLRAQERIHRGQQGRMGKSYIDYGDDAIEEKQYRASQTDPNYQQDMEDATNQEQEEMTQSIRSKMGLPPKQQQQPIPTYQQPTYQQQTPYSTEQQYQTDPNQQEYEDDIRAQQQPQGGRDRGSGFFSDIKDKFKNRGKTKEQIESEKAYKENAKDALRGIPPTVAFMERWLNDRTPSAQEKALKGMSREEFLDKIGANYKRWQDSVGISGRYIPSSSPAKSGFAEGIKGIIDTFDPSTYRR